MNRPNVSPTSRGLLGTFIALSLLMLTGCGGSGGSGSDRNRLLGDGGYIPGPGDGGTGDGGYIPGGPCPALVKAGGSHSGVQSIDFGGEAIAMAGGWLQSDGKFLLAGYAKPGAHNAFAMARVNRDGSLDAGFGNGGKVLTPLGQGDSQALDSVLMANGRIVLAGPTYSDTDHANHFAVARYLSNGALDESFGNHGIVVTALGNDDQATAVRAQPDGKILVGGMSLQGSSYEFAVVRYDSNGNIDATYGRSGIAAAFTKGGIPMGGDLQADGKLVLAGFSPFSIARFATDGSLDATFGSSGTVETSVGGTNSAAFDLRVQADGKMMAAGTEWLSGNQGKWASVRYLANGNLDPSWGQGGIVTTSLGGHVDSGSRSVLSCGNTVLMTGVSNDGQRDNLAVVRYLSNGSLDPSFATGGILTSGLGSGATSEQALMQSDGRILVEGNIKEGSYNNFLVVRLNADGTFDSTFGR